MKQNQILKFRNLDLYNKCKNFMLKTDFGRILSYVLIFVTPIVIFIYTPSILLLFFKPSLILGTVAVLITSLILMYYMFFTEKLLNKLNLNIREDLMKIWTLKFKKNTYYKLLIIGAKLSMLILNYSIVALIIFSIIYIIVSRLFIIEILKNLVLLQLIVNYSLLITSLSLTLMFFSLTSIMLYTLLAFPRNKILEYSEILHIITSLFEEAIENVNIFDCSLIWERKHQNIVKISNTLSTINELVSTKTQFPSGLPYGMTYPYAFTIGFIDKSAKLDILYRINNLSENLKTITLEVNYMETENDKLIIQGKLVNLLNIIKTKNLSNVLPLKYSDKGFVGTILDKILNILPIKIIIVTVGTVLSIVSPTFIQLILAGV